MPRLYISPSYLCPRKNWSRFFNGFCIFACTLRSTRVKNRKRIVSVFLPDKYLILYRTKGFATILYLPTSLDKVLRDITFVIISNNETRGKAVWKFRYNLINKMFNKLEIVKQNVGIDVSKDHIDAAFSCLTADFKEVVVSTRKFSNTSKGFDQLRDWVIENYKNCQVSCKSFSFIHSLSI